MSDASPGARLQRHMADEMEALAGLLLRVRAGDDGAVHQARKSVQRLRAAVRLCARREPESSRRANLALRRLRRRLGPLRDAAARRATLRALAASAAWEAHRELLARVAETQTALRDAAWRKVQDDPRYWPAVQRDFDQARTLLAQLHPGEVRAGDVREVVRRAARSARRRIRDAAARYGRSLRHELRRKLRRLASTRRLAARLLDEGEAEAEVLVALGKRLGREGDLWMAIESVRAAMRTDASLHPLLGALEAHRRRLCLRHDRALARLESD